MKKWRFVSNQNSIIVGINDAGIETFTADMNRSLVREAIQNSLDAVIDDFVGPVEVEFSYFDIPREAIPDVNKLQEVINKCKMSNENEPDAFNFFTKAENILSQSKIHVLRISDHNTKGLEGTDTCEKGTSWSRLVKESGSSNKGQGSGGSFGIGKAAAFACSDLRTVFYSSKDVKGLLSNFGVAKLVSFENEYPGDWTTGIGYYSEDERFTAIHELAEFDSKYKRIDSGTDIYILGMHQTDNFKNDFVKAVLLDFLVSLVNKKLIVRIQNEIIDSNTLPRYMSKLNPYENDSIKDLLEYYHILTSNDPRIQIIKLDSNKYGKKFGFKDGECTLYLKEGESLNRKIMITRRAGMRILEQNRISGSIDFTGVLVIEGDNMNETFKKMEVPSHDAWEPGRVRGEQKKFNNILAGLRKYLRDTIKDTFGKVTANSMDAWGASDFLPDIYPDENKEKLNRDELSTRINMLEERTIEPTKEKVKNKDIFDEEPDSKGTEGSGKGEKPRLDTVPGEPHPGSGQGTSEGENGGLDGKNSDNKNFKNISVKKRLICKDANSGIYTLNLIVPSTTIEGKLEFTLSGEQSDFELPIIDAKIIYGNASIKGIHKNIIFFTNLKEGENLKVEVNVDFDKYCMMEVDYYACKK